MVIRPPTICPIPQLPLRAIHHQLRGATGMERVPHTSLSPMLDHHKVILAILLATSRATPNNHSINSSTAGSLNLLMDMAIKDMVAKDMAVQPNRNMLLIMVTAKGTSSSHHTGDHSMNAIKHNIS